MLSKPRRSGELPDLQPDAKSQVTVRYVDGKAVGAPRSWSRPSTAQTRKGKKYNSGMVREMIAGPVEKSLPKGWMPKKAADFFVNPTGNFVVGGPDGDCGLTGRKIIVDTYGGYAPHGGGAFSGKDPTKVDRSAAYAARYLAKNVVAAGLADRCLIQVAYAIGVADPMSLYVDTQGTGKVDERKLEKVLPQIFPLRPTNIRRGLQLNKPIYQRTAAYGHFGRKPEKDGGFSWEQTDLAAQLKKEEPLSALTPHGLRASACESSAMIPLPALRADLPRKRVRCAAPSCFTTHNDRRTPSRRILRPPQRAPPACAPG